MDVTAVQRIDLAAAYRDHAEAVMRFLQGGFGYRDSSGGRQFLRVKSAFDAEELCQEVFSVFIRQVDVGQFDVSRPIKPYLCGIARFLALKKLGKASREVLQEEADFDSNPAEAPDPEDRERARLVMEFQASLEEKERAICTRYFADGASQQEVGEQLGLSRDQVYRITVKIREKATTFFRTRGWLDEP